MRRLLALMWACLLVSACAAGRPAPPQTTYDFGLSAAPIAVHPRLPGSLAIATVRASDALGGTGIIYRLAYENAARPEIYSQSRWAAPPAELLTLRLQQKLAAIAADGVIPARDGVQADKLLRVELEEFTQVFDTPDGSRAVVQMRASLIDPKTNDLVAQADFRAQRPADPDAAGAAHGLREASDAVFDQLAQWVLRPRVRR